MPKIRLNVVQRAEVGDIYYYKTFGPKDNTLVVVAESPTPGYKGYYAYLCEVHMPDGRIGHSAVYGFDLFNERGVYTKAAGKLLKELKTHLNR